jgi:cellobiose epimerase
MMNAQIEKLKHELENELHNDILKYWMTQTIDEKHGGFIGSISHHNVKNPDAPKGSVVNTRILWTFASAYRVTQKPEYLKIADRAFDYLEQNFIDKKLGGIYWELDCNGKPKNPRKQIYAIAFAIYAMAEYNRATGNKKALQHAIDFFTVVEKYSLDIKYNGYVEALTENWQPMSDYRLSPQDANESKTMNTHLHVMEAYACLYRVWKDPKLEKALRNLIELFIDKFIDKETYHLNLFFDDYWALKSNEISFGHDIECSWLLFEAAEILGNETLIEKVKKVAIGMADSVVRAIDIDFGLMNEEHPTHKHMDTDKHWWPQAEAVVGFFNAYQISGDEKYLQHALESWEFIKKYIIDHKNGEWFWKVNKAGVPYAEQEKAGFWKCPYHNSRMCIEIIERTTKKTL